jgi:hypothetical protein
MKYSYEQHLENPTFKPRKELVKLSSLSESRKPFFMLHYIQNAHRYGHCVYHCGPYTMGVPRKKLVLLAPTMEHLQDTFSTIRERIDSENIVRDTTFPYPEICWESGTRIRGFRCDFGEGGNRCSMLGQDADFIITEDTANIDFDVFRQAIWPMMYTDTNTRLISFFSE